MGQVVGSMQNNVAEVFGARRKRRRSTDSTASQEGRERAGQDSREPKKKKLLTTTQYIYKALFKEQKNTDVAVMAMDKVWHLHKVYLSQSPYFYTMFNGSWKEAQQSFVHIKILDDRISVDSLDAVFGSMYSDEIAIEPRDVIPVLATGTLFHLDGIIDKCVEVMVDTINAETAIQYYEAACQYGVMGVKKSTFQWFQVNLLSIYNKHPNLLRHISIDLMSALTGSHDLYVMQTEFSLYTLLRSWMFLQLHPEYDPEDPVQRAEALKTQERLTMAGVETYTPSADVVQWAYFTNRMEERSFLATPEGQPYVRVFQKLRTQYLTNHYMDLKIIFNDNIIPREWLFKHIHSHWDALLRIDHGQEDGTITHQLDAEQFYQNCMRCGRTLVDPGYQKWRWTGFNYGMDLILIMDSRRLNIRRHHRHEHERVLSLQTKRKFMIRTTITSINAQRQPIFTQTSEITTLNLEKNEEVSLMVLDPKLVHPLLISINMLIVMPPNQSFKEIVPLSEESTLSATGTPISEIGASCERPLTPSSADDSAVCVGADSESSTPASPSVVVRPTVALRPSIRFNWTSSNIVDTCHGEAI